MCCPPLIFKPSLGRREKLPQKVRRREKLAEKLGRREIYRHVPPPSFLTLAHVVFPDHGNHDVDI